MAVETAPPIKAPFNLCLWVSDVCELECRYCYAAPFSGRLMDSERIVSLVDEAIELDIFDIAFAGGEPFLHPEIFRVIERAVKKGMQVGVLTNGIALDEEGAIRLANIVGAKKNFLLQISIDSPDPTINDQTRGRGKQVVERIRQVASLGIPLQLSTVVTSHNIDTAASIIDAFYPQVKRFHFLNVQRTEKAMMQPDLFVTEEEAEGFWLSLRDKARMFPDDLFLPSLRIMLRACEAEEDETENRFNQQATFDCNSCSAGITHINIDADFNVLGCDIAKDYTHMGNVRRRTFDDVWRSPEAAKIRNAPYPACYNITNTKGESLRDYLRPECMVTV